MILSRPFASRLAAATLALGALPARADEPSSPAIAADSAAAAPAKASDSIPLDVTADRLWYDGKSGDWILEGHVVVVREGGIMHASRARYFRDAQALYLDGPVLGVQGTKVTVANSARIDAGTRATEMSGAVLYVKQFWSPQLQLLSDPAAARGLGHNTATLHAESAVKQPDGSTVLGEVSVTPCDCPGKPDYEIDSAEVLVEDNRAWLAHPHIRFLALSMPFLPLALPLEDRQSGMLAPQLGYTNTTGFRLAQPIYFTLGRSWDLTLTPGIFTGPIGRSDDSTSPSSFSNRSVWGPRLGAELRWAPVDGVRGELGLDLFKDFSATNSAGQDPATAFAGEALSRSGRGLAGLRGALHLSDRIESGGWTIAADGKLLSDTMFLADTEPALIDRFLDSLRTDLGVWHNFGILTAGLDGTFLQDLRLVNYNQPDRRLFGIEARSTPTRIPSPFLQLLPELFGPFTFSAEASAVGVTTFAHSAQENATGFGPTDLGGGSPSVANADLARAPTIRFDLAPRIAIALPEDSPIRGQAFVGARADDWLFAGHAERDARRLYGTAGAEASALFARPFGSLMHTVEPQLFFRAITPSVLRGGAPLGDPADGGGLAYFASPLEAEQGVPPGSAPPAISIGPLLGEPFGPYRSNALGIPALRRAIDELDGSAPSTGEVETSFAIRQSLWNKPSVHAPPARVASLTVQQDFLLWDHAGPARAADTSATASLAIPHLAINGELRWDWHLRVFSFAQANATVSDSRGDDVHGTATALVGAAGDHIRAGIDELFAATLLAANPGVVSGRLSTGVGWALPLETKGLRLGYDLTIYPGIPATLVGVPDTVHTFSFSWSPPCGCASLALGLDFNFHDGGLLAFPNVRFNFQLQGLGR